MKIFIEILFHLIALKFAIMILACSTAYFEYDYSSKIIDNTQ